MAIDFIMFLTTFPKIPSSVPYSEIALRRPLVRGFCRGLCTGSGRSRIAHRRWPLPAASPLGGVLSFLPIGEQPARFRPLSFGRRLRSFHPRRQSPPLSADRDCQTLHKRSIRQLRHLPPGMAREVQ